MTEQTRQKPPCQARTKLGGPCRAFALPGGVYCWGHEPSRVDERTAARSRGGQRAGQLRLMKGRRARLDQAGGLLKFAAEVVLDVRSGLLDVDVARTTLYGCGIVRQLIESSDLEKRLASLEQSIQATRGGKRWSG